MPTYRLHAHDGDDLGLLEHPAPNLEPGDVVLFADGREALVTARVEAQPRALEALLEVTLAPEYRYRPHDTASIGVNRSESPRESLTSPIGATAGI